MSVEKLALLFPGQGACYPGVLEQAAHQSPDVRRVFDEVDAVAQARLGRTVSAAIWGEGAQPTHALVVSDPDILQLAIFATSLGTYRLLTSQGVRADVLMGHSFGEIAALVCAGAFTVSEGAEIVCHRIEASRLVAADGYMAALGADASVASTLVALLGEQDVVIAGENSSSQTVLSGSRGKMDRAEEIAKVLNYPFFRLNSPYPFHSPLMEPVRAEFGQRLQRFTPRPLTTAVFSPIAGRYYEAGDSLTDWLADHLVRPVAFGAAVQSLYSEGCRVVVECGALDALTKLAARAMSAPDLTTVACFTRGDDRATFQRAIDTLRTLGRIAPAVGATGGLAPAGLRSAEAAAFWSECAPAIQQFLDSEYSRFVAKTAGASFTSASAPVAASPAAAAAPAVGARNAGPSLSRSAVLADLVATYAAALEYPEDVFAEDVDLEAELGIDSVKQTELLARVSESYGLPPRPADFRLSDYNTIRKVTDFVVGAACVPVTASNVTSIAAPVSRPHLVKKESSPAAPARNDVLRHIVSTYAAALEYPEDVFTADVELEAELGIDSVKQTELMARVATEYGLPPRPADFRLSDYNTPGRVADFVLEAMTAAHQGVTASSRILETAIAV
jgi:acyl transferase domain-containing protein